MEGEGTKRPRGDEDGQDVPLSDVASTDGPLKKVRTHKKKRLAIMYGYLGKGYHGSQKSDGVITIEHVLEDALRKAGALDADNNLGTISFTRASRTDKGVSAMVNVAAGNFLLPKEDGADASSGLADRLNASLPDHIRVWAVVKVRGGFSAKDSPCSRTYDYVCPAWMLMPHQEEQEEERDDRGWVCGASRDKMMQWQSTPEVLEKLNQVLLYFVGTHNYHNYTNGKNADSNDAKRVITSFRALRSIMLPVTTTTTTSEGEKNSEAQYIHFRIKGQSFMLHQIRKMMCMVFLLARNAFRDAEKVIRGSFGRPHLNIPKAPAVGLFLREVHFDVYNKKWGRGEGREPVLLQQDVQEKVEQFAQHFIWPQVVIQSQDFEEFLADVKKYPLDFAPIAATADAMEEQRRENEEKRKQLSATGAPKVTIQKF